MRKIGLALFGIFVLAIGIFMLLKDNTLNKNCTAEAAAVVVDINEEWSADDTGGSYTYFPVVEYQVEGETFRMRMSNGTASPEYKINDRVTILYNPDNAEEFIVKGDNSGKICGIVASIIGVFLTGIGLYAAFKKQS